jgi:carbon monoxide dehydrogenase subunit G
VSQYSFSSRWHIAAPQEDVWRVFEDLLTSEDPFVWWPGMNAERRGGEDIHVSAASPVGYTLRFRLHDLVPTPMDQVTLQSDGDLAGSAAMRLSAVDDTNSTIDVSWHVDVTPRWMRMSSFALHPVFVLAHDAVMKAGERGLNAYFLAQQRSDSDPVG